jgi:phage tail protein X
MTNIEYMERVKNYNNLDPLDKFVLRSGWKPKIYGIHKALFNSNPGVSNPGFYIRNGMNIETVKRIHREELECIILLKNRIKLV